MGYRSIVTSVASLFALRTPPDITRLVSLVVVHAVKGVTLVSAVRQLRDMIVKCSEVMPPIVADCDAATTISIVGFVIRVGATSVYVDPSHKERVFAHAMSLIPNSNKIAVQTTARLGVARTQVYRSSVSSVAAVALAVPDDPAVRCSTDRAKRNKATKLLARNVFSVLGKGDKLRFHQSLLSGVRPGAIRSRRLVSFSIRT